jgi:outer membrane protein assembly factor BamB
MFARLLAISLLVLAVPGVHGQVTATQNTSEATATATEVTVKTAGKMLTLKVSTTDVTKLAFSSDEKLLAIGATNGEVIMCSLPDGTVKWKVNAGGKIQSLKFADNGKTVSVGFGADGEKSQAKKYTSDTGTPTKQ